MFSPKSFLLLIFLTFPAAADTANCEWKTKPTVISKTQDEILLFWDMPVENDLFGEQISTSPAFQRYKSWVTGHIKPDPAFLLTTTRKLWAENGLKNPDQSIKASAAQVVYNIDLLLSGRVGKIRTINCIESLILSSHTEKFPIEKFINEFQAAILMKRNRARIYLASGNIIGTAPSFSSAVFSRIQTELQNGWTYSAHLHNHPFTLPPDPITPSLGGMLAPSQTDLTTFKRTAGLKAALITNGFHTLELAPHEFAKFKGRN